MLRGLLFHRAPTRHISRPFPSYPSSICPSRHQIRGTRHCRDITVKPSFITVSTPIRGHLSVTTIAIATVCVALATSATIYSTLQTLSKVSEPEEVEPRTTIPQIATTAGAVMPQPGRPGNLTADQEVKLKELWKAVFKVFGVQASSTDADGLIDEAEEEQANGDTTAPAGKEKKKRRNLFSRKKKNKDAKDGKSDEGSSAAPSIATGDSDDKYGQTKEFFEALANNTPEDLHRTFWTNVKCEHPDALLLRFLRARKWDVEKALVMMISTMQWRNKQMHVEEDVVRGGEGAAVTDSKSQDKTKQKDAEGFLDQLRKGKSYVHGKDKEGRPLTLIRVRLHHGGEQTEKSIEQFTVHIFEITRIMLEPPADTGSLVFDMTGFSLANMDYTPVKFMIKCFEANYPESLGVCIVHKAPWVFQGIWKIIKGWLDPVVAAKVHFTNSVPELENYIDKSTIVKEMGGDNPFEYEYVEPREGENKHLDDTETRKRLEAERADLVKEFEEFTAEWAGEGPSDSGGETQSKRTQLADRLKKGYWELDPHIRARSLYDRIGVLSPDGKVDWPRVVGKKSAKVVDTNAGTGVDGTADASDDEKSFETAEGGAASVAAGMEGDVADKDANPNAAPPGTGAANTAAGLEEKVSDEAASKQNGPTPAAHDPDGLD